MKKILFVLMLLISINACAQSNFENFIKITDDDIILTSVDSIEDCSADELYKRALIWISNTYKEPKSVIQTQDAEANIIVIKGIIPGVAFSNYGHKLKFQFKDNRYKWEISNIVIKFNPIQEMADKRIEQAPRFQGDGMKEHLESDFSSYINSFREFFLVKEEW